MEDRACIDESPGQPRRHETVSIFGRLARLIETARHRVEQGEAWIADSPDPAAALTARYR